MASRSGLLFAYKGNHFFANKQISCCFFFLFREEFFGGVQSIPLPKIRQLNKHFFYLCSLLEHPCRANPARIGAGAAHYKTLSNPLFRTVEPAHRSWDANGDSVHKVGIPSPPKKYPI